MNTNKHNTPDRLLRIQDVIGCKKQGVTPIVPVSRTAWYAGIAEGIYPDPVKLGERTSAWRESDIMAVVAGTYSGGDEA